MQPIFEDYDSVILHIHIQQLVWIVGTVAVKSILRSETLRFTLRHFTKLFAAFIDSNTLLKPKISIDYCIIFPKMSHSQDNTWSATEAKDNQQEIAKLVSIWWLLCHFLNICD